MAELDIGEEGMALAKESSSSLLLHAELGCELAELASRGNLLASSILARSWPKEMAPAEEDRQTDRETHGLSRGRPKAAPAPEAARESAAEARSVGQLSAMKVTGLKALCKERGLSGKGKKAELVARLLG